jgi:ferritin-like metal-binding protein YciE
MDTGNDFLKSQVHNAVAAHHAFVSALEDHASQADDTRFRDLCSRYLPTMRDHQRMLEDYQQELGAPSGGMLKRALGATANAARDLADSVRESDFLRLVGDIVMSRQSEDTFKTFREAGRALGLTRLASIGETGERDHDAYNRDANQLVQQLFVEQARQGDQGVTATSTAELSR